MDFGRDGKEGAGKQGWVKRLRVVRPAAGKGAAVLQFGAEKRTLIQTERMTLPLHPLDGAGGSQNAQKKTCHQTKPRMELYRDGATLYKCTPTKTADLSSPPHYTQPFTMCPKPPPTGLNPTHSSV